MARLIDVKWQGSKPIGWADNMTLTFNHSHGLDHGFSWSNFEIALSQEWEGQLTLNKRDGSQSFMTMTMTFWWPKCKDLPDSDRGDFRCLCAAHSSNSLSNIHLLVFSQRFYIYRIWIRKWVIICRLMFSCIFFPFHLPGHAKYIHCNGSWK